MTKLLLAGSMITLVALNIASLVIPQDSIFWFASVAPSYQILRGALAVILFILLVTKPPRHILIRFVSFTIAVATAAWTYDQYVHYAIPILDALLLSAVAITILIVSLEAKETGVRIGTESFTHSDNT